MKIIFVLIAILIGIFCGLMPGIHPNTAGAVLANFHIEGEYFAIIVVGILGAYTAVSFLPAIFLVIPEGDTVVSLLPGQRMFRKGRAFEAIIVVCISLCLSAGISFVFAWLFFDKISFVFGFVSDYIYYILILFSVLLLIRERKIFGILSALLIFLLSGILGFLALNSQMQNPLFCLFAGFFALPALIMHRDFFGKGEKSVAINKSFSYLPYVLLGIILGGVADLLPGISTPSQLAVFGSLIARRIEARNFLAQIASIEASHCIFSIGSAASVGVARVGAIAIAYDAWEFDFSGAVFLSGVFLAGLGVGAFSILFFGKKFERYVRETRVVPLAWAILSYLILLAFFFDGIFGLLVMAVAGLIGFLPVLWGVSRTHVMGSIILVSIMRGILA